MEEPLSTTLLAISMLILGLVIGLAAALTASRPSAPQTPIKVAVYGQGGSVTVTITPPCQLAINSTGIYNTCTGLIQRLNGSLDNFTIVVG
ncbi:MAG: hypothetical protein ACP5I3_00350 [Thermoproteus sp.]|jgi:hypothetical protein